MTIELVILLSILGTSLICGVNIYIAYISYRILLLTAAILAETVAIRIDTRRILEETITIRKDTIRIKEISTEVRDKI